VGVSPDVFRTVQYRLSARVRASSWSTYYECAYGYSPMHCPSGIPISISLAPGQKLILDYAALELPPTTELDSPLMKSIVHPQARPYLSMTVWPDKVDAPVHAEIGPSPWVHGRPEQEMQFLNELYAELARRKKAREEPKGWEALGSAPCHFGLTSFEPSYPDLVEKLIAYEQQLSAGSLRDVVHLVRLTQIISGSEDQCERERTVDELLDWLDTLHEIERHYLAEKVASWAAQWVPDAPTLYALVYGVAERLPERLYQFEGYREYIRRQYTDGRPGFEEYLRRRQESARKGTKRERSN